MTDKTQGEPHIFQWSDYFPWLLIFRTLRPAMRLKHLAAAAFGMMATQAGWRLIGWIFAGSKDPVLEDMLSSEKPHPDWFWNSFANPPGGASLLPEETPSWFAYLTQGPLVEAWTQLTYPFEILFREDLGFAGLAYALSCGLWGILVWSMLGGMITRSAALELTRGESPSLKELANETQRRLGSFVSAPLFPLLGIFLAVVPILLMGLVARFEFGALLVGLFWFIALFLGLFMTILMLGLVFGWPLMWATISTERTDAFDALSRSFAYVLQRPLHYAFYIVVASLAGSLGWIFVDRFAAVVLHLSEWSVSWGLGAANMEMVRGAAQMEQGAENLGTLEAIRELLFGFWTNLVRALAAGFVISYFWSATSGIYLLLRRDVDGAELDDIDVDEPTESLYANASTEAESAAKEPTQDADGNGDSGVDEE